MQFYSSCYKFVTSFTLLYLQFDLDGNGHITCQEIGSVMKALGEDIPGYKLREIIKLVDKNENGTVEFNEFLEVSSKKAPKFSAEGEMKTRVSYQLAGLRS